MGFRTGISLSPFLSLRYPQFRYLWLGNLGTTTAQMMDMVTRGWLVYDMTGSAAHLAFVTAIRALPLLFVGLLAGVLADRFDRKKLLLISQFTNLVLNLIMGVLIITGWINIWMVYATSMFAGIAMAVQQPARQSMIPATVPKEALQNAVVLNSSTLNIGQALGPAIGGFLVGIWGNGITFFFQAALFAFSSSMTRRMSAEVSRPPQRKTKESMGRSLIEGFCYVRRNDMVLALLVLSMVPMFFGSSYQSLVPIFSNEILNAGPQGTGILLGVKGVGSVVGVFILAFLPSIPNKGRVVVVGTALFGFFVLAFDFSTLFLLSVVLLFFAGFCWSLFRTLNQSMLLKHTDKEYLGRVNSIYLLDRGLMPLGTVAAGLLAEYTNVTFAVGATSFLCLVLSPATLLLSSTLWQADKKEEYLPPEESAIPH